MKFEIGDIVICSNNKVWGRKSDQIIVENKYHVVNFMEMSEKNLLEIIDENKKYIGIFDSRHFISLSDYRNFKIKNILQE